MELHIKYIVASNIKASAKEHRNIIPNLLVALESTLQPHIFGLERELLLKRSEHMIHHFSCSEITVPISRMYYNSKPISLQPATV